MAKLKEEKTSWQNKFLNLLEGNKRPREEDTLEEASSRSKHKSVGNTLGDNPRTTSSRDHSSSSTSTRPDRGRADTRADTIIYHPHLSRVVEMDEQGKRSLRAELNMSFDPWDPQISRGNQRLVTLALWKREVRGHQRYVPDYSDHKASIHHTSHGANLKVGLTAFKDFAQLTRDYSYQEAVKHLHDDFHKYHIRNYIPRVVGDYWKILNDPKMSCYTRCVPVDAYYEEVLRDTPGFKYQALPRYKARPRSPIVKSEKSGRNNSGHNSGSSPDPSTLYTWANEVIVDVSGLDNADYVNPRMDHLTLDEHAEVKRIAGIVKDVRAGNPPKFYSAMREKEIKSAQRIFAGFAEELKQGRPVGGMIPEWATGVTTHDFSTKSLESKYDYHQAQLIFARVTRIVETADSEFVSNGPSGQGPK